VTAATPVVALLYDGELAEDLPAELHDRPVDVVIDSSGPHRCSG
jgi:5-formyltetrahydrofolate cyclo-ligase